MIDLDNVKKFYGDFEALKGVSLKIEKGQIFGYLGPNGAGKTTTIKLLLGLIKPSSGKVSILGEHTYSDSTQTRMIKKHVGSMMDFNGLYENLSAFENMVFWAKLYGMDTKTAHKRSKEIIELVKLSKWIDTPISKYSYGMTKRLSLARALVSDPDILILDEPTGGVDPESRFLIRDIMNTLAKKGKTIFFSSHDLEEVQKVCTHIALLKKGQIIAQGTLNRVLSEFGKSKIFVLFESATEAKELVHKVDSFVYDITVDGPLISFYCDDANFNVDKLVENALKTWKVAESLEEVYLNSISESGG